MSRAKKSFGNIMDDNPALQYITVRPKEDVDANNTQDTYNTPNTQTTYDRSSTKETKTKRIYPIIQPSLRVDFEKVAYMQHVSMNELLIRLIKEHVQEKQELIDRYDELLKRAHDQ